MFFLLLFSCGQANAAGPAASRICSNCVESYTEGIDAGAYKDIPIAACGGSPCFCQKPESPCFDSRVGGKMVTGGQEHQEACCGLCSVTAGCVGWVISSGKDPHNEQDSQPTCWIKNDIKQEDQAPNRGFGKTRQIFSCQADWGEPFVLLVLGGGLLYLVGGSIWGARLNGGNGAWPRLKAHPHHRHMLGLFALVMDGIYFVQGHAGGNRELRKADRLGSSYGSSESSPNKQHLSAKDKGGKDEKKKKKTTKQKQEEEEEKSSSVRRTKSGEVLHDAAVDNTKDGSNSASRPQVVATPAGGGGRWVHVPA